MEILKMLMEFFQDCISKIGDWAQLLCDNPIFEFIQRWMTTINQLFALGVGIVGMIALVVIIIMGIAEEAETSKSSQTETNQYDPALDLAMHLVAIDTIKKIDEAENPKNENNRNYFTN